MSAIKTLSVIGKVAKVAGVIGTAITPLTEIRNSMEMFNEDLALIAQYTPENYNQAVAWATIGSIGDACSWGYARSISNTIPTIVQLFSWEDPKWTQDWTEWVNSNMNTKAFEENAHSIFDSFDNK